MRVTPLIEIYHQRGLTVPTMYPNLVDGALVSSTFLEYVYDNGALIYVSISRRYIANVVKTDLGLSMISYY
jgi:hypothetical protein